MGSHGMRARTRQRRGLSEAIAAAAAGTPELAARLDPLGELASFVALVEHELGRRGLEVADIGGPWVDRSAGLPQTADAIPCRCGHPRVWHRWDGGTPERPASFGPCEITGPQPADGCDCERFERFEQPSADDQHR
jgi:hypothetical protein